VTCELSSDVPAEFGSCTDLPPTPAPPADTPSESQPLTCDSHKTEYQVCLATELTETEIDSCISCMNQAWPSKPSSCSAEVKSFLCDAATNCGCNSCSDEIAKYTSCKYPSCGDFGCAIADLNPLPSMSPSSPLPVVCARKNDPCESDKNCCKRFKCLKSKCLKCKKRSRKCKKSSDCCSGNCRLEQAATARTGSCT
jgi:hypothetical protein